MAKIKITKNADGDIVEVDINKRAKIIQVVGKVGEPGMTGPEGAEGPSGEPGKDGKAGSPGQDFDPQQKKEMLKGILNNSIGNQTNKKVNKALSEDIKILDGNINLHISDDNRHFKDKQEKDKVIEHVDLDHTRVISGGGGGGGQGPQGPQGDPGILPLDGSTENGIITYDGDGTGTVESDLSFDGNKLYFGGNQEASIGFDGTNLSIESTNPSHEGVIKFNDDVLIEGKLSLGGNLDLNNNDIANVQSLSIDAPALTSDIIFFNGAANTLMYEKVINSFIFDDDVYITGGNITVDGTLDVGGTTGSVVATIRVKTDVGGKAINVIENSGNESWSIGVNVDGDLEFYNSNDAASSLTLTDDGSYLFTKGGGIDIGDSSITNDNGNFKIQATGDKNSILRIIRGTTPGASRGAGFYLSNAEGSPLSSSLSAFGMIVKADKAQLVQFVADNAGNQIIFTNLDNRDANHDHATQTDPTIYIHSDTSPDSDNTEWVSFTHDKSNAVFGLGSGKYAFPDGDMLLGENLSISTDKKIYLGDNNDSELFWSNDQLNIDFQSNPSGVGTLQVFGNVVYERQYVSPDSVSFTAGSSSSSLTDLEIWGDGKNYTVNEANTSPGSNLEFTFNNITKFSHVLFRGYYEGSTSHAMKMQLYNYDTSLYDTVREMLKDAHTFPAGVDDQEVSYFAIPPASLNCYISGGTVLIRFIHTNNGNTGHFFYIDYFALEV